MATATTRPTGASEDRLTLRCTALVGVCAAALNFTALSSLAAAADYPHWLDWCYPVCVDAYGLTAARVWLRGRHGGRVTRWARGSSLFALVISMAAAGLHTFTSDGRLPIGAAFAVSTLPALMLGLAVHLLVLVRADVAAVGISHDTHDEEVRTSAPPQLRNDTGTGVEDARTGRAAEVLHAVRNDVAVTPGRRGGKRQAARVFYDAEIGSVDGRGPTELGALLARRFDVHEATGRQWVTAFRREDDAPALAPVDGARVLRGTS